MEKGEKRAEGMGGGKKNQMFPYITALAVCDKELLQLRYKPDVWAKHSQLISQAFIDNEDLEEGNWKIVVFSCFQGKRTSHMD